MNSEQGYFEKGVWIIGIPPAERLQESLIGKKIVRTGPCMRDFSYSRIDSGGNPRDDEWVILRKINKDYSFVIEWQPRFFPGELHTLPPYWNDGNWIEQP